jgi:hypothetical protein
MNSARPQRFHSAKWEEKILNGAVKYVRLCTPPTSAEGPSYPTSLEKTSVVCHNLNNQDNVVNMVTFYYKNNSVTAIIKC